MKSPARMHAFKGCPNCRGNSESFDEDSDKNKTACFGNGFGKSMKLEALWVKDYARASRLDVLSTQCNSMEAASLHCETMSAASIQTDSLSTAGSRLFQEEPYPDATFQPGDFIIAGTRPQFQNDEKAGPLSGFTFISQDLFILFINAKAAVLKDTQGRPNQVAWRFSFTSPVDLGGDDCLDVALSQPYVLLTEGDKIQYCSMLPSAAFQDPLEKSNTIYVDVTGSMRDLPHQMVEDNFLPMNLVFHIYRMRSNPT